jgi:hypothetical protein
MLGPYRWLAGSLAVLLLLGSAYAKGRSDGSALTHGKYAKAAKAMTDSNEKVAHAARLADAQLIAADQARQTEVREIIRVVPQIIDRPVYRTVCVDADGVRLIERATAAANGRAPAVAGPDGAAP